ncbi:MAG TPA: hypothetical protein RMI62_01035, partial [Polyangiaceae bacterium LLY-WYZ-15_(1-7)]|nr:hypothetical protein [Polyangiaceae bacterium LLY-WYZ-15_(1-7)]
MNGRTYDLVAVAEAVDGTVWSSPARSLVVDGDESPTNPGLTVALTASASGTWIPGTTELRAQVQGSAHPVARVELYRCDAPSGGDCALVASTPGPEFVFWRADAAGVHHYFARVVDVHGNGADSTRVELERVVDGEAPSIGGLRLEGPLKDGQPIEGQPYEVVVEGLADAQSGFDVATLERNGAIVAVTVVGGELRYSEPAPTLAESLTYRVVARDRAGLERTLSASFTVREDAPPTALLEGVAGGVDEGRAQRVFATLADDVAMASARYRWQGAWRPLPLGPRGPDGTHRPSFEITYEGERLTAPVDVPLELEATDIAGHTTAASVPVRVRPLTAPQPDQFHVSAPDRIYLGTSATVSVELRNGGRPVTLSLIDVSAEPIEVARRDGATTLAHTFRVPDDYAHDALRFFARAVDALGQTGQSAVVEVPIVRHPNTVAFVTGAGATPAAAGAGDPVSLTVEVRDAAARPVAGQPVRFLWRDAGLERFVGLAPTDGEGRATVPFDTARPAGSYTLIARVEGFSLSAEHALSLAAPSLRFAAEAGLNPPNAPAGEPAPLAVVLESSTGAPLANQPITLELAEGEGAPALLGELTTDAAGRATYAFDTSRPVGAYSIEARAEPFGVDARHALEVTPGDPVELRVAPTRAAVEATQLARFTVQALDAAGNVVTAYDDAPFALTLPDPGLRFVPSPRLAIEDAGDGRERAVVTLAAGAAEVAIEAGTAPGAFAIALESAT